MEGLVERYAALATIVRPAPIPPIAPDPDDDAAIAAAIAAKAEFIVTGDRSLLSVASDQGVRIVNVSVGLQNL